MKNLLHDRCGLVSIYRWLPELQEMLVLLSDKLANKQKPRKPKPTTGSAGLNENTSDGLELVDFPVGPNTIPPDQANISLSAV